MLLSVTGVHKSAQSLGCHLEDDLEEVAILLHTRMQKKLHLTGCLGPLQVCADHYEVSVFAQESVLTVST